jgi:UDP-2,4-diacetamido-2,4,6-trideoxy-beta-L-altropyranose hydrolase
MRSAILRADGSLRLGMGHVMRCLALADALARRGVTPVFVVRELGSAVPELVRSRGYEVLEIRPNSDCSDDAELTVQIAADRGADIIMTDLCHGEALKDLSAIDEFHRRLRSHCFTVSFAGGTLVDIPADIVVSPYYRSHYPPTPWADRILLVGPRYFVFRREFVESIGRERVISQTATKILVTIGGSDHMGLTPKVGAVLASLDDSDLRVRAVVGPGFSDEVRSGVDAVFRSNGDRFSILDHTADLADQMFWADIAVTGDGLTKYETAATGTPSIMLSTPDSAKALNLEFERAETTHHLGEGGVVSAETIAEATRQLLGDATRRRQMSENGIRMVDGAGIERIFARLPGEFLSHA